MTRFERNRLEMFTHVHQFGRRHARLFPASSVGGQAFAALADVVKAIEKGATSKQLASVEGLRFRQAARKDLTSHLLAVARTARTAARHSPDLAKAFVLPASRSDASLLAAARTMARDLAPLVEACVALGLPPTFLEDLRALTDKLEEARRRRKSGRTTTAASQRAIVDAIKRGFTLIRTLDTVVANVLGDDPGMWAAWRVARHPMTKGRRLPRNPKQPAGARKSNFEVGS